MMVRLECGAHRKDTRLSWNISNLGIRRICQKEKRKWFVNGQYQLTKHYSLVNNIVHTILPLQISDESTNQRQSQALDFCETEGMDTTSELERTDESATSLRLSSEQLHDNIVALAVENITQSSISQRTEPIRLRSGSHPERRPARTDSGQWSTISEPEDSASATLSRLRSSSHGLDSSVDPDSSALSLDSSNGSTSQGDISQSEVEESIQFSASEGIETTRTSQQELAEAEGNSSMHCA